MAAFDPISALLGGCLIGIASAMLMGLTGRISGILGGALSMSTGDKAWRLAFLAGLVGAPMVTSLTVRPLPEPQMPASWILIAASGVLVGFGTRLGGGCTSGHGVCGMGRMSRRSIIATVVFMASATIVVTIVRHGMGG